MKLINAVTIFRKDWNQATEWHCSKLTNRIKKKRVNLFVEKLRLGKNDIVLDLGSEDGSTLAMYYPYPKNIILADIEEGTMRDGVARYGLKGYEVIPKSGGLPFKNHCFDAVWCNSVIEHVIGDWKIAKGKEAEFKINAYTFQSMFANEIERISKKYFIQTPYAYFPIESHSWLPFVHYLTHIQRLRLSSIIKKIWIKQWNAGFVLYDIDRFKKDFKFATEILFEKVFWYIKALIAIRK